MPKSASQNRILLRSSLVFPHASFCEVRAEGPSPPAVSSGCYSFPRSSTDARVQSGQVWRALGAHSSRETGWPDTFTRLSPSARYIATRSDARPGLITLTHTPPPQPGSPPSERSGPHHRPQTWRPGLPSRHQNPRWSGFRPGMWAEQAGPKAHRSETHDRRYPARLDGRRASEALLQLGVDAVVPRRAACHGDGLAAVELITCTLPLGPGEELRLARGFPDCDRQGGTLNTVALAMLGLPPTA